MIAEGLVWAYGKAPVVLTIASSLNPLNRLTQRNNAARNRLPRLADGMSDAEIDFMQNDVQRQKGVYQSKDDASFSAAMADNQQSKDASLAEIEAKRQGALDILESDRMKAHETRRSAYEQQLVKSQQELDKAKAEWQAAIDEARQQQKAPGKDSLFDEMQKQLQGIGMGLSDTKSKLSSQGTFSAAAARGLSGTSAIDRTAAATERMARGIDQLNRKADDGGLVFG